MRASLLSLFVLVLGCQPDDVVVEEGVVEGALQAAAETTACEEPSDTAGALGDPMGRDTGDGDTGGEDEAWDTGAEADAEDGPEDVQGDDPGQVGTGGQGGPPGGGPQ